jgi:RNA polymerase sigma-70 factor (sigma-E family)
VSVADLYDGFREFFVARRGALSRTAFLLTGDHGEAEDLLQEALTKTVGRWRKVSAGDNPEGYVRQVMLNEVRSRWRRRRRGVEHPMGEIADSLDGHKLEAEAIDRSVLASALRQLTPKQRAVLYLRFYEDRSETETAEMLGCAIGTVKSQTHDALVKLRSVAPELVGDTDVAGVDK